MMDRTSSPPSLLEAHRLVAGLLFLASGATILAALFSEHALGMRPCLLCLYQRWPYYVAVPLAGIIAFFVSSERLLRAGLALIGLIFLASAGLAAYHAGVEWGFFLGPAGCGGAAAPAAASMDVFLRQLETVRVVDCSQPAFVFLGLSMAGWNGVISLLLAGFAIASAATPSRRVSLT
jgi:disulfide bond formation protein DsbB